MHTGVSSSWAVWQVCFERYTRVLMKASLAFPIHFLKIYTWGRRKKLALITELFCTYMEPLCCVSRGKSGEADTGKRDYRHR